MDRARYLQILESIPATTQYDRLYVQTNGLFAVDTSYAYTGSLGRSIMDTIAGGYNRATVLRAVEDLVKQLKQVAQGCVRKLDTVYVQGNARSFGLETDETKLYMALVLQLSSSLWKVQGLIEMLQIVYRADTVTHRHLDDCLCDVHSIEYMVDPFTGVTQ